MVLTQRFRPESGMTLIEVTIASLLLLVIALGVLPLFMRATSQNVSAEIYTNLANQARARAEEYRQLPFGSTALTIPAGQTALALNDYYSRQDETWTAYDPDDPPGSATARWLRTTTIEQYNLFNYIASGEAGEDPTALDGGAPASTVQLKKITVDIAIPTGPVLADFGGGRILTVEVLKSN